MTAPSRRHHPHDAPLRVLVGNEQFSENHAWSEMPQYWPAGLVGRTVIEVANSPRPPQPPFEVRAFLDAP